MSSNLAYALPQRSPSPQQHPRHIEIVSTRAQRRARPKVFYALVTVSALFALFLAQLLLSIFIADAAYQINNLQSQQRSLVREEQALTERLDLLGSPQNLATQAEALGMVSGNSTPAFLRLSDGAVIGSTDPRSGGSAIVGGNGALVPNSLLSGMPPVPAPEVAVETGAPTMQQPTSSVASGTVTPVAAATENGILPSPVTR